MLGVFPLITIPAAIYAVLAMSGGADGAAGMMQSVLFQIPLPSNAVMPVTWGHLLLMVSVLIMFVEILKSSRRSSSQMVDNALSVAVFIICFSVWLLVKPFGTMEFFVITMMSLLDFLTGSIIAAQMAQRTVQYDQS